MNPRADLFNEDLKANMPNTFEMEEMDDPAHTVIFKTSITVKERALPLAVFFDDSVLPMIRVFLAPDAVSDDNRLEMLTMFNNQTMRFKAFKIYTDVQGNVMLDVCLPALDEHFDLQLIHAMIDLIIEHLNNDCDELLKAIWKE